MTLGEDEERRRKVAFLSQIRLGDLIVAGTVAVGLVAGWTRLDARQSRVEEIISEMRSDAKQQRVDVKELGGELRAEIRDVRNSVEQFGRKLERRGP